MMPRFEFRLELYQLWLLAYDNVASPRLLRQIIYTNEGYLGLAGWFSGRGTLRNGAPRGDRNRTRTAKDNVLFKSFFST